MPFPLLKTIIPAVVGLATLSETKKSHDKATDDAEKARQESRDFIQRTIDNGATNIFKLYDSSSKNLQSGLQSSMDLFKETIPQRLNLAQDSSIQAQQAILGGLPRARAALLGNNLIDPMSPVGLQLPNLNNIPNIPQMTDISQLGLVLPVSGNPINPQQIPPESAPTESAPTESLAPIGENYGEFY